MYLNRVLICTSIAFNNKLKFSILNWFLYYLHSFHRNEEAGDATDYIYMYLPYPMYSILTSCLRYYHCVKCSLWTWHLLPYVCFRRIKWKTKKKTISCFYSFILPWTNLIKFLLILNKYYFLIIDLQILIQFK